MDKDAVWSVLVPTFVLVLMRLVDSSLPKGWMFRWVKGYMVKVDGADRQKQVEGEEEEPPGAT